MSAAAARELAALLKQARAHWGIPDPPAHAQTPLLAAATERMKDVYLPQVIALYRTELTNAQIAIRLDLPLSTVQYIIHAARASGTWPAGLTRSKRGAE